VGDLLSDSLMQYEGSATLTQMSRRGVFLVSPRRGARPALGKLGGSQSLRLVCPRGVAMTLSQRQSAIISGEND